MNEQEQFTFVTKEIEAIYEDFDDKVNQLILLRYFLNNLLSVTKGAEPSYQFSEIKNKIEQ